MLYFKGQSISVGYETSTLPTAHIIIKATKAGKNPIKLTISKITHNGVFIDIQYFLSLDPMVDPRYLLLVDIIIKYIRFPINIF